jgi:hypothetical protein
VTARISLPAHSLLGSDPGDSLPGAIPRAASRIPFATSCGILSIECSQRRPKSLPCNKMAFVAPGWERGEATSVRIPLFSSVGGSLRLRFGDRLDGSVIF